MRCTIPEISWHNREPVLSVDIHPVSNDFYRLASGGGDSHILIWQMTVCENGSVKQEVIADLTRHQKAVNTVRWSPSGQYLASADDDANIIVWQLKTDNIPLLEGESEDKEIWIVYKILRGHKEDVYDMCWSVDNKKLLSGSVDNTAILWDLVKGKMDHILSDHKGFVQGVAWDPKGQFLATISTDRICRLFDVSGKHVRARIHKGKLPLPSDHFLFEKESKYFHDDTFKSFFRRLEFSPDGSLLVVPSGHIQAEDCKKILNATLVFTLDNFNEPAIVLPLPQQSSTVVRFCPILFEHHLQGQEPFVRLPYRMIFAVGTDHDVILYDTQQSVPFARFHEIHYTRLTDLTWSGDGSMLVASSTDGFCALITFEKDELGIPYSKEEELEEEVENAVETVVKDENVDVNNKVLTGDKEKEKTRSSFLKQWAQKQTTAKKSEPSGAKNTLAVAGDVIMITDDEEEEEEKREELRGAVKEINRLMPRRIQPTRVEEGSEAKPLKTLTSDVAAKPIAVRRHPRKQEDLKPLDSIMKPVDPSATPVDSKQKPVDPTATPVDSIALSVDPIPKSVEPTTTPVDPTATPVDPTATPVDSISKPVDLISKPVDSISKPVDSISKPVDPTKNKTLFVKISEEEHRKTQCALLKRKTSGVVVVNGPQEVDVMEKVVTIENVGTPKSKKPPAKKRKDTPTKVKVSSLVGRKSKGTPKSNPLLNFLTKKSPSVSKIDLALDEDEARDGWTNRESCSEKKNDVQSVTRAEEDCTEDFCLQLEDTQDEKKGEKSGSAVVKRAEDKVGQPKVPRRVPLITLASPKSGRTLSRRDES
ncbi:unnamed protein product [Phaedon cochleariae]|uniref:CAF1B/HIR1 beta-propeller domain-containing protein n=1 Tax=Phaedon cochleariae TaxID=80249 RepID=A0A9P0DLH6_PHACE|nr:unnamed protein product [Phaedon cochleariae]